MFRPSDNVWTMVYSSEPCAVKSVHLPRPLAIPDIALSAIVPLSLFTFSLHTSL